MKKYIPLLLLLASCGQPERKPQSEPVKKVSVQKSYSQQVQQKVIGDINFGISEDQYNKLYAKLLKSKKCKYGCDIGNFHYDKVYPSFDNNQLYSLEFTYIGIKSDTYDSLVPDLANEAYQAIRPEYGEPDKRFSIPSWAVFDDFQTRKIHQWDIGDKAIHTVVSNNRGMYSVSIMIYSKKRSDAVDHKEAVQANVKDDSIKKANKGLL